MTFDEDGMPVDELIDMVKSSIAAAGLSSTAADRDLRVALVELTLQVVTAEQIGGGVDLRVPVLGMKLKLGAGVTRRRTHTVTIALEPPSPAGLHEIRDATAQAAVVDAVDTIRRVLAGAAGGQDPFVLRNSTVELIFAITRQGTITLVLDGGVDDETIQTLRLTLVGA